MGDMLLKDAVIDSFAIDTVLNGIERNDPNAHLGAGPRR